ncbi:unnamed protein product [Rotaria magnacalcarata]|uniref:Uncharacterized protein n=1 Tax=Rotaria magnacalcarata TaxID=392030 RepID=A0A815ULV0_9BILA|nr:unnamed protein product [Rotaria magnacalcarata]CAF1524512.1 unnamed protein product [Rotaria magnacalcarata]CAF1971089.1 unnamed protein product [Rotaria magnacalcarata]CAF2065398.1 unnamed protein product [Rotaria magnacalcarata]CAF2222519.1 unnamed protein product [Rotaria magnacalcarata]
MLRIGNNVPRGSYPNVRNRYLSDRLNPFEHELFLKIVQAFPLLTHLTLNNRKRQKYERMNESEQNSATSSIAEFSHLTHLNFIFTHIDYPEQFLVETNTHLPSRIELTVGYEALEIVTENFTRDTTRRNCSLLECINVHQLMVDSKDFYSYFPSYK